MASSTVWHPETTDTAWRRFKHCVVPRHNSCSLPDTTVTAWRGLKHCVAPRHNRYSLEGLQALCDTQTVTAWRASSTVWHQDTTVTACQTQQLQPGGPQALCGTQTQQLLCTTFSRLQGASGYKAPPNPPPNPQNMAQNQHTSKQTNKQTP